MKHPKTILALDPGARNIGYAVLRSGRLLASGVSRLPRPAPEARRAVGRLAREWLSLYRPAVVVLELAPRHSQATLEGVYRTAERIRKVARAFRVPLRSAAAQTARKGLLGNGWADKREAARAVCRRFPELAIYLRQDRRWKERHFLHMFDAVALALHEEAAGRFS
jgi:Holliday junction resolvasome RuvABC endonuclease subunit